MSPLPLSQEQHGESSGEALVEEESHAGDQVLPERGEEGKIHSGSPGWGRGRMSTPILARRTCSFQKVINPLLIGDYRVFSESAVFQFKLIFQILPEFFSDCHNSFISNKLHR